MEAGRGYIMPNVIARADFHSAEGSAFGRRVCEREEHAAG